MTELRERDSSLPQQPTEVTFAPDKEALRYYSSDGKDFLFYQGPIPSGVANLTDIPIRNHDDLQEIQGKGTYHLSETEVSGLHDKVTVEVPLVLEGQDVSLAYDSSSLGINSSGQLYSIGGSGFYQPLNTKLTSISNLADASGVLTNDGSGNFSYSSGGSHTILSSTHTDTLVGSPLRNDCLKWNGSEWTHAAYNYDFTFSIASFSDGLSTTALIGTGVWKVAGALSFSASYNNGPPSSAYIVLTSNGGVSWPGNLNLTTPFTSVVSTNDTAYPAVRDEYVTFTLNALLDGTFTSARSVSFPNNIKYGVSSSSSGWSSVDINALTGTWLSNTQVGSFSIISGSGQYILFCFPSSYTSINTNGFLFNNVICPFAAPTTVSVTNNAGYTENYKVYCSNNTNLGSSILTTNISSLEIDPLYWGVTSKTSSFTAGDITGLANNVISNTSGRTVTVVAGAGEYIAYALPTRLGGITFWVGGFQGGFQPAETVSITNINGYTEDYYIYRSTNSGLGSTTVTIQAA